MKTIELTWEDIISRIEYIKKKNKITSKTKIFGVPKNGMIVASFFGCKNVYNPEDADIIVDDIIDSGKTKKKYRKMFPKKKFIVLFEKDKKGTWINFPYEKNTESDYQDLVVRLLQVIGEDPNREGLLETPKRVINAYKEFFSGYKEDANKILEKTFGDVEGYDDMVIQKNISVQSHCEHHMVPIIGIAHIAYIPNERVVGLSKLGRVVDVFSKRLQTQERLTLQIAKSIMTAIDAKGVAVTIDAAHQCMTTRGIKKEKASTVTNYYLGQFKDDLSVQNRYLRLINQ